MEEIRVLKTLARDAITDGWINRRSVTTAVVLVVMLYIGTIMMFFGMNFWLWSFAPGLKRSYTSILFPSILWSVLFLLTCGIDAAYSWLRNRKVDFNEYFFWINKKGVLLLFLIGLFDSLTGLTGMYAAIHVSQILQSALISTGPIWTFLLSYVIYPESQPKFHPFLILVVVLTVTGVALATVPQITDKNATRRLFSLPWTLIYLAATALFPLYNVLQGRFLNEFSHQSSPFTSKMVMLAVETTIQLGLTVGYFPADFSPFYGRCSSAQESWDNLVASVQCIFTCPNNGKYMVIYVMGFWIRHVVFAYLNTYSPSIAAVTSMLTQPINTFIILAVPSWNVYGSKKEWGYTFGCFFCLLLAMVFFIMWHLTHKQPHMRRLQDITVHNESEPQSLTSGVPLGIPASPTLMKELARKFDDCGWEEMGHSVSASGSSSAVDEREITP